MNDSDISNSYTMVCLPVCEDNLQALVVGFSPVHMGNHDITNYSKPPT